MPYTRFFSTLTRLKMPDLTGYITTQEAADRLGYHVNHIRRMIREGNLKAKKVGYMWFVNAESVEEYKTKTAHLEKFDPRRGNE